MYGEPGETEVPAIGRGDMETAQTAGSNQDCYMSENQTKCWDEHNSLVHAVIASLHPNVASPHVFVVSLHANVASLHRSRQSARRCRHPVQG